MTIIQQAYFGTAWRQLLTLLKSAPACAPRGKPVRELLDVKLVVWDGLANLLVDPVRNVSYRFAVAEWLWIWFGRDDVATISQYNKNIAQFSDNGVNFNGAYGVPVRAQWDYVMGLLLEDSDTRQAVIQIYRPPARPTKDVPCTLSVQFLLRDGLLNVIVNMRSSDVWLGLPYDFFNFSMLGNIAAAQLGVELGQVSFNLGSSHLYGTDQLKAELILGSPPANTRTVRSPGFVEHPPDWLEHVLVSPGTPSHSSARDPWLTYARVLIVPGPLAFLETLG